MSYREEGGQVTLTMSREDYESFNVVMRRAFQLSRGRKFCVMAARLLDRLNQGNPNYTPYQVGAEKEKRS